MRDCSKNRGGFDRVMMAVAASFLTVSTTSARAQGGPPRSSAAELAIDAAVPRPEPANVPPPTVHDFKMETTAAAPAVKTEASAPAPTAAEPAKDVSAKEPPAQNLPANELAKEPAQEPVKAASNLAPADQPVADRLKEILAGKVQRYFDRKTERSAVEKFYGAREYAPLW